MANKPVIGYQVCPYCGGKVPVIWDGNRKETCMYCKKRFQLKRQKLKTPCGSTARRRERWAWLNTLETEEIKMARLTYKTKDGSWGLRGCRGRSWRHCRRGCMGPWPS